MPYHHTVSSSIQPLTPLGQSAHMVVYSVHIHVIPPHCVFIHSTLDTLGIWRLTDLNGRVTGIWRLNTFSGKIPGIWRLSDLGRRISGNWRLSELSGTISRATVPFMVCCIHSLKLTRMFFHCGPDMNIVLHFISYLSLFSELCNI